jgi:hypothetical protein
MSAFVVSLDLFFFGVQSMFLVARPFALVVFP